MNRILSLKDDCVIGRTEEAKTLTLIEDCVIGRTEEAKTL